MALLPSAYIKFQQTHSNKITIMEQHFILQYIIFSLSRIMSTGWRLIVSGAGGDDSSSGCGSDMGAAQNSLDVWTNTGKE